MEVGGDIQVRVKNGNTLGTGWAHQVLLRLIAIFLNVMVFDHTRPIWQNIIWHDNSQLQPEWDMNGCTEIFSKMSHGYWNISLRHTNQSLMEKKKDPIIIVKNHPPGTTNVWTNHPGDPSNGCFCSIVVGQPRGSTKPPHPAYLKNETAFTSPFLNVLFSFVSDIIQPSLCLQDLCLSFWQRENEPTCSNLR